MEIKQTQKQEARKVIQNEGWAQRSSLFADLSPEVKKIMVMNPDTAPSKIHPS